MNTPNGPSGWYPDPYGRFEYRFHNGAQWTADVSVGGQRFVDPQGVTSGNQQLTQRMLPISTRSRAMAVTALVVGIGSVLIAWLPFLFVGGAIGAVVAFVFGIAGRRKAATQDGYGRGLAIAGIVLSIAAALLCIVGFVFTRFVLRELDAYQNPAPNEHRVLTCDSTLTDVSMTFSLHNLANTTEDFTVELAYDVNGAEVATDTVLVDSVPAGETTMRESNVIVRFTEPTDVTCRVKAVYGPSPFDVERNRVGS